MDNIFSAVVFGITLVIVLWILSDPKENTKIFLGIPSLTILLFSLIVLGTDWSIFGHNFEQLRLFLAGIVAIPYVISSGFAFFLRVYAYMWELATRKQKTKKTKRGGVSLEDLIKAR